MKKKVESWGEKSPLKNGYYSLTKLGGGFRDTEGIDDDEMEEYNKAVAELAEAGEARSLMFG